MCDEETYLRRKYAHWRPQIGQCYNTTYGNKTSDGIQSKIFQSVLKKPKGKRASTIMYHRNKHNIGWHIIWNISAWAEDAQRETGKRHIIPIKSLYWGRPKGNGRVLQCINTRIIQNMCWRNPERKNCIYNWTFINCALQWANVAALKKPQKRRRITTF